MQPIDHGNVESVKEYGLFILIVEAMNAHPVSYHDSNCLPIYEYTHRFWEMPAVSRVNRPTFYKSPSDSFSLTTLISILICHYSHGQTGLREITLNRLDLH